MAGARKLDVAGADAAAASFTWEEVPGLGVYNSKRRYALVTHSNGARGLVCSEAEVFLLRHRADCGGGARYPTRPTLRAWRIWLSM